MQATKVFLNGRWVGLHRSPDELKAALLKLRRTMTIPEDVSLVFDHSLNEVRINNDWGRVCRPLYVVERGSLKLNKGIITQLKARCPLYCRSGVMLSSTESSLKATLLFNSANLV
jgi:DNA-directed RNA polymerase II subunit RPB2